MQIKDNKEMISRFFAEIDNRNYSIIDELIDEDYFDFGTPDGAASDRAGVKDFYRYLHSCFPDVINVIHDIFSEDDKIVVRKTSVGTHTGQPFFGIEPKGKKLKLDIINIFQVNNSGKIFAHWHALDSSQMFNQLR